jgi:membrane protease YdiL (CAAX protease family)
VDANESAQKRIHHNPALVAVGKSILFILILVGGMLLIDLLLVYPTRHMSENDIDLFVTPWAELAGALLATYVMLRLWDKRPWSTIGLGKAQASPGVLGRGFLVGLATIGIPSIILLAASELKLAPALAGNSLAIAGFGIATFLPAAFFEEVVMRGYLFNTIRESFGWRGALIVTSAIFGLLHMGNPNVDAESVLLVILAGFFLGAILLATGSLFAAGMAHFGWNWMMAAVLHTEVSGVRFPVADFRIVDNGPDWLTGGAWGPEGGLAAGVGMIVAFIYLYARRIRRLES